MRINFKVKYLGIILAIISGYFFLYYFSGSVEGFTFCIFKQVTGVPCPACGSTRATLNLLHGQFWTSLLTNPLALFTNLFITVAVFWMAKDICTNKETFFPFMKRDWSTSSKVILLVIVALNWIWNIYKGL